MFTDFVINFDFKNDRVIAAWKFWFSISSQQFSTYILWIDPSSEFSKGYDSVIFKVKIYDKISTYLELPRQFKNTKKSKKIWGDF